MPDTAPPELIEWMTERLELINKLARRSKTSNGNSKNDKEWTLTLLENLSEMEAIARRGAHLLTGHALRDGVATATEISKASNVTIATAMSRGGSKLTQEVWNEVYPN